MKAKIIDTKLRATFGDIVKIARDIHKDDPYSAAVANAIEAADYVAEAIGNISGESVNLPNDLMKIKVKLYEEG